MKINYEFLQEAARLADVPEQNKVFSLMMKAFLSRADKITKNQALILCAIIGTVTLPVPEVMKNARGMSKSASLLEELTTLIMKKGRINQTELDAYYKQLRKARRKLFKPGTLFGERIAA